MRDVRKSNISGAEGVQLFAETNSEVMMQAFDALPRDIRQALARASIKIAPTTVHQFIARYGEGLVPLGIQKIEEQSFGPCKRSNLHPRDANG